MLCDWSPGVHGSTLDAAWGILPERCGVGELFMSTHVSKGKG